MRWSRALITLPVLLFDAWWFAYRLVLTATCMIVGTLTLIALSLAAFGIRWGW